MPQLIFSFQSFQTFLNTPPSSIHFVLAHIGPYTEKQNHGIQERGLWRLFQLSH